jgi:16S rRNA processing protein RimM
MPDSKSTDNAATPSPEPRKPRKKRQAKPAGNPRSDPPATRAEPGAQRRTPPPFTSRPLAETAGPDPDVPLSDVRLAIGTITGTHGTNGELKLRLSTDDPEQLRRIKRIFVGDEPAARTLVGVRFHQGMALIRIKGVANPEQGAALRGQTVRISGKDARPLEPGEFYYYQVVGITAYDETGEVVGTVSDILETGANEVFVITPAGGGKDILLPNIPDVVLDINSAERRMTVRPLVYWES